MNVQIEESWKEALQSEFDKPYFASLVQYLHKEKAEGRQVFPPGKDIFKAFELTSVDKVKVVILGQDPYHERMQAQGLSFSVPKGVRIPPSLVNIYKELNDDMGIPVPSHGCLKEWASEGVLLLNAVLTVRKGNAGSHAGKGWEILTDRVIELLNEREKPMVFILWGAYAQKKAALINERRHCVIKSVHPSPLSAYQGFFGFGHFKACNDFLKTHEIAPIDWRL